MSNNRSTLIWVAIGAALLGSLGTLVYLDTSKSADNLTQLSRKSEPGKPPKPEWQSSGNRAPNPDAATNESLSAQNRRTIKYPKPTLDNPPAAKQVREEAAADTHSTPQSLIEFAEQLAESVEAAYSNTEIRYNVSRQLIACAKDSQSKGAAQAARALCLSNLERLKQKFPEELFPSYQALLAELPDDLIFVSGVNKSTEEK